MSEKPECWHQEQAEAAPVPVKDVCEVCGEEEHYSLTECENCGHAPYDELLLLYRIEQDKARRLESELHRLKHPTMDDMTEELPTKPGLYWWAMTTGKVTYLVQVINSNGFLYGYRVDRAGGVCRVSNMGGLWLEIPEVKRSGGGTNE